MTFEESEAAWRSGKFGDDKKIIEGQVVTRTGFFAWQVAIGYAEIPNNFAAQFCGGVSLSPSIVLTAAHCILQAKDHPIFVLGGTAKLSAGGTRHAVSKSVVSPLYDAATKENDLAVLKVDDNGLSGSLPVADMPDALLDRTFLTISGWGVTDPDRRTSKSDDLREASVPTQTTDVCNAPDALNGQVKASMFCAGNVNGGSDACLGDSGGPAVVETPQGPYLVGLSSWGDGCGLAKKYGVYARVFPYMNWIKTVADGN
ncbi:MULTISPECIES: serine protease [unclassified Mesorhizobium]|uniref:serine protease n=1 Tax=unclassified Mesorhizobium TaxID=325217 RepID=UPI00241772EB|nr:MULTISPECIES: serine protease [unclassified Mesorhizobium]WFP61458.1 serine protease [Mesorhizobium sp. WSM4904]WFP74761.1 serine protease [Mesorhizobium sp. WSM4906]